MENDDSIIIESEKDLVHLSMLFKWYHSDFGANKGEILQWIHDQFPSNAEKLKQMENLFEKIGKDNVTLPLRLIEIHKTKYDFLAFLKYLQLLLLAVRKYNFYI